MGGDAAARECGSRCQSLASRCTCARPQAFSRRLLRRPSSRSHTQITLHTHSLPACLPACLPDPPIPGFLAPQSLSSCPPADSDPRCERESRQGRRQGRRRAPYWLSCTQIHAKSSRRLVLMHPRRRDYGRRSLLHLPLSLSLSSHRLRGAATCESDPHISAADATPESQAKEGGRVRSPRSCMRERGGKQDNETRETCISCPKVRSSSLASFFPSHPVLR